MVFSRFAAFGSALVQGRSPVQSPCRPLPLGLDTAISPDTPEAFQAYAPFASTALAAVTPAGYVQSYTNLLTTYNAAPQFVHYVALDKYDVDQCAHACDADNDCNAFTIFFERQPVVSPARNLCSNPPSTTIIKCDLWSGTIQPDIAINHGQLREKFHVVMAGSNAYVKDINRVTPSVSDGYAIERYAMGVAIEAPLDCNGNDTYMGLSLWGDGHFDVERCIDVCKKTHDASGRQCRFVNTYMQRRNKVPTTQHCALFSQYWPAQYATNVGQRRGSFKISISSTDSYGIRDISGDFSACLPGNDSTPSLEPAASVTSSLESDASVTSSIEPEASVPSNLEPSVATTLVTSTLSEVVWETPSSSESLTSAVIAPETFSHWDPVMETTTYATPTASASSSDSAPAVSASSSDSTDPIVASETSSALESVLETDVGKLVIPTFIPEVNDVPDLV
ncbi:hypothetical protein ACET3X_004359 [Alternaria dauci]|uniref:Apple domain-containing protein n=1 Tax=Alternaria dauci TaxID=48095 RepID=A0ABR3UMT2_9PLEO